MSNGISESDKRPLDGDLLSLDEAAALVGMSVEEFRTRVAREITAGGEFAAGVRVPRGQVLRLAKRRRQG
jgi:hypothetical protein